MAINLTSEKSPANHVQFTNGKSVDSNIISAKASIDNAKEQERLKINAMIEEIGLEQLDEQQWKEGLNKMSKVVQSASKETKPEMNKKHVHKKRQQKKNNLKSRKAQFLSLEERKQKAKARFEEYVKQLEMEKEVKAWNKNLQIGFGKPNWDDMVYYGFLKDGMPHGFGVMIADDGNTIDDQLLLFDEGVFADPTPLLLNNLGSIKLADPSLYDCKKERDFDECMNSGTVEDVYKTIHNRFVATEKDPNLCAHYIDIDLHGDEAHNIFDSDGLILKTKSAFDKMKTNNITGEKPVLMLKHSCYNAVDADPHDNKFQDDFDLTCKSVSNITNADTICAHHNNDTTTAWEIRDSIGKSETTFDMAYDHYKGGKLISKDIANGEMNKLLQNCVTYGRWDRKMGKILYLNWMSALGHEVPAKLTSDEISDLAPTSSTIVKETESDLTPTTSTIVKETDKIPETNKNNTNNNSTTGVDLPVTVLSMLAGAVGYAGYKACKCRKKTSQAQDKANVSKLGKNNNHITIHQDGNDINNLNSEKENIKKVKKNNNCVTINTQCDAKDINNNNASQETNDKNNITNAF